MGYKLLLLSMAGALGTLARVGLSTVVQRATGLRFPWGTVTVNLMGCFLFGMVWAFAQGKVRMTPELRLIVLGGFLGAFTTFSTFVFDIGQLMQSSRWLAAGGNLLLQNAIGILALFAGIAIGRAL